MAPPPAARNPAVEQLLTPSGLVRHAFAAMGTTVVLLLPSERAALAARVEELFTTWQATCTRFDPGSELSRLNAAGGRPVAVGELLFGVLGTARRAAEATGGLFDPTLLRSLEAIGYDRDFEQIARDPGRHAPERLPATGGWRDLVLDPERRTAQLPPGVGIDLGGLAKGMAVDAAIREIAGLGLTGAVDAGGDLAVSGLPVGAGAWSIAIEGPEGPHTVSLRSGALATSSVARRRWDQDGIERHHLVDPRTGLPSTVALWSATVAASTCAQAEVAAKAAFLLGPAEGSRFLAERSLAGLFVGLDGSVRTAGPWAAG